MKKKRVVTALTLMMIMVMAFTVVCLAKSTTGTDLSATTKIKGTLSAEFLLGKCSGTATTKIVDEQPVVPVQVYVFTYNSSGTAKYSDSARSNTNGTITKAFTKVSGVKVKSTHYAFSNKTAATASNVVKLTLQ